MPNTIFVLNGPNLNLLGMREPELYGHTTLADVEKLCRATAQRFGLNVEFHQSNHEGQIIDWIQQARAEKAVGLIINPAGFTTTSISILDALYTLEVPVIEIHITNIHARESFRHDSYVSQDCARGDLRLWCRRLRARHYRPCRPDRRQGRLVTRKPEAR